MSSSKRVIFIRHALPVVQEAVSSRLWPLSDDGRRAVLELAGWLRLPAETYVVSSDEAKARETAEAFSDGVALDHRLREVSRPWIDGDYKSLARSWLNGEQVEDWEAREVVLKRMGDAVGEAMRQGEGSVCVVTHGMAMSTYIADTFRLDPVRFWSGLEFPDARIVDFDTRQVHSSEGSPD